MYVKKKSIEGYFAHSMAIAAWRKGKATFDEISRSIIEAPDGRYDARMVEAGFEIAKARPYSYFVFELPGGQAVKKTSVIDSAEGIARVMLDFAKVGIVLGGSPLDLERAYEKVALKKPKVPISIQTRDGLRGVVLEQSEDAGRGESAGSSSNGHTESVRPAPQVEIKISGPSVEQAGAPEETKQSPAPSLPQVPSPESLPNAEADIKPGDKIVVKIRDKQMIATVLKEFPEDYELAVHLEDGNKVIISGNDVVSMA